MTTVQEAAEEAAKLLRWAERGYDHKYGSVPLDTRVTLAQAWIDLAGNLASAPKEEA